MKIFYHNDLDGHCSGAIVHRYLAKCESDGTSEEYIEIDYKDPFPFDSINLHEFIYIVDFSLQTPGDWQKLFHTVGYERITGGYNRITWIDHHKTAIEHANKIPGISILPGIRQESNKAACELCWEYFFPHEPMPRVVKLLGDYDTWSFKFGDATRKLQSGIRLHDTHPTSQNWNDWFNGHGVDQLIQDGEITEKYRNSYYAKLIKSFSFPLEFEGYKCIACNAGSVSSQLFDSLKDDYDIMMPFVFDGKKWTISFYTKKDIDVSEIAKKYGGGGHPKAAGCVCDSLPFGGKAK